MAILEDRLHAVREIEHCPIPMADGVCLSARLWLPDLPAGEAAPAILEYIPYRKRDMVRARDERNHPVFARHGYACLRVDMRGSGDSEGTMADMYGDAELEDALAVIDWIARQPWCNGAVGMMGTSWGGTASLQAAARRPEALRAIIAVCATDNRFDDDIHHMGGCLLTDTVEWGATLPAILASPPDPETIGPDWRGLWLERLEALTFPLENWVRHETRDAYWRRGSLGETPQAIDCPALLVGGWGDRYSNTVMNSLGRNPDRCCGIVGPWGHHYPDAAAPGPGIDFQREALKWWDRWLKVEANGIESEPRLRVWQQAYDPPADKIERRSGCWLALPDWPSETVMPQAFWLTKAGLAPEADPEPACAVVPWALEVGAAAGDTGYFGRDGGLPGAQDEDDARSLIFESPPLEEALEILGSVRLEVQIESDQPNATLVARLNDVPPSGPVSRVTYGVRNLALDEDGRNPSGLAAGRVEPFVIALPNTAYRFEKGHRVRLALSSSYWPIVWPSPKAARLVLNLTGARLILPKLPAGSASAPASLAEPAGGTPRPSFVPITDPALERRAKHDPASGLRYVAWHQPFKSVAFPKINLVFGFETQAAHKIDEQEPNSASSRFQHRLQFQRQEWNIEIDSLAEVTSTETEYKLSGRIEVRENGKLIFQRQWQPTVPRRFS